MSKMFIRDAGAWKPLALGRDAAGCMISAVSPTTLSIPNTMGQGSLVAFPDTDTWDTDSFHDSTSNNTRITVQGSGGALAGWYQLSCSMNIIGSTAGESHVLGYRTNGSGSSTKWLQTPTDEDPLATFGFTDTIKLLGLDYVEIVVFGDSTVSEVRASLIRVAS